jgi:uncharacterized protein YjbI with pentapeptide repeats
MADDEHVAILRKGVAAWNKWRSENLDIRPNLREAELREENLGEARLYEAILRGANLSEADLSEANLSEADLYEAHFYGANLRGANLSWAKMTRAYLREANLSRANLYEAYLRGANLSRADLRGANLSGAYLLGANLWGAILSEADLRGADLRVAHLTANISGADLRGANLSGAILNGANLSGANLSQVALVRANLTGADLTGCRIYGISAWDLKLEGAKQENLIITPEGEPAITVDNIEVAQFIYLMLNNKKIRDVIDTIGKKAVLILGRFTADRKAVLDALREELRKRDYLPILFDFEVPTTRDITETVSLLARMTRFIIADLTDPSSIPKELEAIIPGLAVPVQPLLEGASRPYAMFKNYWKYEWVLPVYRYEGLETLLLMLAEKVIAPAEGKVNALQEKRRVIEAELTKAQ